MKRILFIVLLIPAGLFAQNNIQAGNEKAVQSNNTSVSHAKVSGTVPTETFVAGNEKNAAAAGNTTSGTVNTNTTGTVSNKRDAENSKPQKNND